MRVFKDLDLVEQLGSGIPRVLRFYSKNCFQFSDNFLRVVLPSAQPVYQSSPQDTPQDTPQDLQKLLILMDQPYTRTELQRKMNLQDREHFRTHYLQSALQLNLIEMTLPDKPNSRNQKYRLTSKGKALKEDLTLPS